MALEREIQFCWKDLPELLANEGKYVLIHHEEVVGVFDGYEDALRAGYVRWLNEPFLVRRISKTEKTGTFSLAL
jgi:hypothetical protein